MKYFLLFFLLLASRTTVGCELTEANLFGVYSSNDKSGDLIFLELFYEHGAQIFNADATSGHSLVGEWSMDSCVLTLRFVSEEGERVLHYGVTTPGRSVLNLTDTDSNRVSTLLKGSAGADFVEDRAFDQLKATIIHGKEMGLDQGALIVTIGYSDSPAARRVLVELADYYLGSAITEAVFAAVSRQGEAIVADIDKAMGRTSVCAEMDKVQCQSEEDRIRFLKILRETAASGELVEYVW